MGEPGLMYVRTKLVHPELTHDAFNHWYNDILMPEGLKASKASSVPGPSVILRYKNVDGSSDAPYVALYPLPDLDWLKSQEWKDVPRSSEVLPGDGHMKSSIEFQIRIYEHFQTFEGNFPGHKPGRAQGVLAAANEVPLDFDAELDRWYRMQHLDMMSMIPGFRRSTRYRLVPPNDETVVGSEKLEDIPKLLALHEFENPEDISNEMLAALRRTEWSQQVVPRYLHFERNDWRLIKEAGDTSKQLGIY